MREPVMEAAWSATAKVLEGEGETHRFKTSKEVVPVAPLTGRTGGRR